MTDVGLLGVCVFPLAKKKFGLNFSATETACWSAMHVCCTYCVVKARFETSPKREATSRSANLFRELFQVVNRIVTNYSHFVYGTLKVRFLVSMEILS